MVQRYHVGPDDHNLENIAKIKYGDAKLWRVIAVANHVCDQTKIFEKEWLLIPDILDRHIVQSGDTFSALALKWYGNADLARYIAIANNRENPHNIGEPGWVVVIPELTEPQPPPGPHGRPLKYFSGTLPYASEIFGVYKPLAGWLAKTNLARLAPEFVADIQPVSEKAVGESARVPTSEVAVLSPVGLINLFRQYFFEFDSFLGAPAGHIWISPGGTVEVVESSTRKTLVEKTVEAFEETTRTSEESLTTQDDLADAVKEENSNDTTLGASASGGVEFVGIGHADASASFSNETTRKSSSEVTHKHTRNQSAKVTSQIRRNFKTTFRTVTETTDTTSRRYVVQNTTNRLVNYELRRKMRKVGVQVQHLRTVLSYQAFVPAPGKPLGLGQLIHVVPAPDLSALKKPDQPAHIDYPNERQISFQANGVWNFGDAEQQGFVVIGLADPPPAPEGFTPKRDNIPLIQVSATGEDFTGRWAFEGRFTSNGQIQVGVLAPGGITWDKRVDFVVSGVVFYTATEEKKKEIDKINADNKAALEAYNAEVAELQRRAFAQAVHDRAKLVRGIPQRPAADLRAEERHIIYGAVIKKLQGKYPDPQLNAEFVRQIFDVDEMLYFVAPDYWRPGKLPQIGPTASDYKGRYPVTRPTAAEFGEDSLADAAVTSSYSHPSSNKSLELKPGSDADPAFEVKDEWRINYPIAEDGQPAPLGSSLGWLIQIDGDARRNQFLNSAWVKAVLPIRPGQEVAALEWLKQAGNEGDVGLDHDYPFQLGDPPEWAKPNPATNKPWTYREVLDELAKKLQKDNTNIKNTLAAETVFENGFDPLDGGFRPPDAYEVFDQWIEVLPTDQIAAVEVNYNPITGQQDSARQGREGTDADVSALGNIVPHGDGQEAPIG
ncbi:LysM peptidoglycan-binding domain-containing protein [Nocardia pseudovaccinii]|uniref:LysM peptidoglycan-binding domain-containing protein n=1 Tax=Nocardia pseudovaccinii TaxID=189540 RepID=UPI003D8F803D